MNATTTSDRSTEMKWTNRIIDLQIPQIKKNCPTMQQTVRTQRLRSGNNGPIVAVIDGRVKHRWNDLNAAVTTCYENSRRPEGDAMKVEGGE